MLEISRTLEGNYISDLVSMTMMLYSMPRLEERCEALCVFCGMGETWRTTETIKSWENNNSNAKYLLIGEQFHQDKPFTHVTIDFLQGPPYNLKHTDCVDVNLQVKHTGGQAEYALRKIIELDINSLALFVSPYHLLRAFCTLLKAFVKTQTPWISLIPVPVAISPDFIIPESGIDAWASVPGELTRLSTYQEKGDVATYQELKDYLSWFWSNSPLLLEK